MKKNYSSNPSSETSKNSQSHGHSIDDSLELSAEEKKMLDSALESPSDDTISAILNYSKTTEFRKTKGGADFKRNKN